MTKLKSSKSKSDKKDKASTDLVSVNLHAKYRPRKISDYVGQDHIQNVFKGWQKSGRVPSSILIHGMTGSGKTTFARLIARYVNCDTFNACGKCPSCLLDIKHHPDVIESDMGTRGKIDDVRALVDSAHLSPRFKRRVFIIDEAHLMTTQAESALLVTTEEPSPHTMWIFCTTNPEKLKDTIRNRFTSMPINPIDAGVIADRLSHIAEKEGYKCDKAAEKAFKTIASFSDGQMRRGIGLLQSVLDRASGSKSGITLDLVNECFASDPEIQIDEVIVSLLAAFFDFDLTECIRFIRKAQDPRAIVNKMRWLVHGLIGEATDTNKFKSASLKLFLGLAKDRTKAKDPIVYSLPKLLQLQKVLCDTEVQFNSTSIPSEVLLETNIGTLLALLHKEKK